MNRRSPATDAGEPPAQPHLPALGNGMGVPPGRSASRRRRLWELPASSHCPVVGVCLPLATLRRIASRTAAGEAGGDDYALHAGMVARCGERNRVSEQLQRELDERHALAIRRLRECRDEEDVIRHWRAAVDAGDIAGALWAALTHPRCVSPVHEQICRDVHMIQHQAGAAVRVDAARLRTLQHDLDALRHAYAALQDRYARVLADHAREQERLRADLTLARRTLVMRETAVSFLREDLASLRATLPDLESREQLSARLEDTLLRLRDQERINSALRTELKEARAAGLAVEKHPAAADRYGASVGEGPRDTVESTVPGVLSERTVLCVGGRTGQVSHYREVIEGFGARYLHHDGGLETNLARLEASIAAADLVICQTGCISHNAYWRVKDSCKRTGKQCLFVENPSASTLSRRLTEVLGRIPMQEEDPG